MKTLLKLITLSTAAVIAYKVYVKNQRKQDIKEVVKIERTDKILPELINETRLDDALVQSFKVQAKVMMDSYPSNHMIDVVHTISFIEQDQVSKFAKYLKKEKIKHVINMDDLSINLINTINTDAQDAFNDIIRIAESTLDYHGIYQGWVFENLK